MHAVPEGALLCCPLGFLGSVGRLERQRPLGGSRHSVTGFQAIFTPLSPPILAAQARPQTSGPG